MPLQATSGAASYDAFGGGVAAVPKYIEEYFSTFLYTGNNTSQTITNGIDLATKGGLVWIKSRAGTYVREHYLYDTARGTILSLSTDTTGANVNNSPNGVSAYNTTGFDIVGSAGSGGNGSGTTYTSWTLAKAPKFFDVVTYSGSSSTQNIAHNLGSVPGCIIVKRTSGVEDWFVYHTSLGNTQYIKLNTTGAVASGFAAWNNTSPTSTQFTVLGGRTEVNAAGSDYVAYLFAHNAGGFGLTGTDNVISCGSFTANANTTVNLGYEPQWIMFKNTNGTNNWAIVDVMRGWTADGDPAILSPNLSAAEVPETGVIKLTATGFQWIPAVSGNTYIYIAIRRGPMKVPTSGTSVFAPVLNTGTSTNTFYSSGGFAPDMLWNKIRTLAYGTETWDKLRGVRAVGLTTSNTGAEGLSPVGYDLVSFNNTGVTEGANSGSVMNVSPYTYVNYMFGRAPSFFDEVCYTGTGSNRTVAHNLGAVPELMIVKSRSGATNWIVYSNASGNTKFLQLNTTIAESTGATIWNNTTPTSSVFSLGTAATVNTNNGTFVAYLFATCAGVSKCGAFTGNGSSQTINCGFTGGARFVMIKATSTTGDWMVADSARGIVAGSDPYLELNNTNAEVTGEDWLDTDSTGFVVNQVSASNANTNGVTYIFLAIA